MNRDYLPLLDAIYLYIMILELRSWFWENHTNLRCAVPVYVTWAHLFYQTKVWFGHCFRALFTCQNYFLILWIDDTILMVNVVSQEPLRGRRCTSLRSAAHAPRDRSGRSTPVAQASPSRSDTPPVPKKSNWEVIEHFSSSKSRTRSPTAVSTYSVQ